MNQRSCSHPGKAHAAELQWCHLLDVAFMLCRPSRAKQLPSNCTPTAVCIVLSHDTFFLLVLPTLWVSGIVNPMHGSSPYVLT